LGDFQVNLLNDSRETLDFCNKIEYHTLSVISQEPTHFQRDSAILIDLSLAIFPENIGMFSQIPLSGIKTHALLRRRG
jgi:hypothetical protein